MKLNSSNFKHKEFRFSCIYFVNQNLLLIAHNIKMNCNKVLESVRKILNFSIKRNGHDKILEKVPIVNFVAYLLIVTSFLIRYCILYLLIHCY